eukprot:279757-Amphidinium_carterae.1
MTEETRKQYVTVTGEGLKIYGWKERAFIVANVQSPLIGLPDLNDNKTTIHTGDKPSIDRSQ